MGSLRLKAKDHLGYRKAHKGQGTCGGCVNSRYTRIIGIGQADLGMQYRCTIMGCNASIRYRISPDYTCNEFDDSTKPRMIRIDQSFTV